MEQFVQDSVETHALLERAQNGDETALGHLLARYRAEIRQAVELRLDPELRARLDASDVVQEAELEAFRRFQDFLQRRPMPFHLWLRKTAYERLGMAWRTHVGAARRSVRRETTMTDHSSEILAGRLLAASTPAQEVERAELVLAVGEAVARLDEIDREVLLLRNYESLSFQEIACLLEIDSAAARKRHARALLRLHKVLGAGCLPDAPPHAQE